MVRKLLEDGTAVDGGFERGTTALILVVLSGDLEVARILMDYGADVEKVDLCGASPVHRAARCGHLEMLRLLIENGASVRSVDPRGTSPLQMAVYWNYLEMVALLVKNGADLNQAKEMRHRNLRFVYTGTPLHLAIYQNHREMVALLLLLGADPALKDSMGSTPSEFATLCGKESIAELFVG